MPVRDPFDLSGCGVVVTGAGPGGLGFEAARSLVQAGARVVITDVAENADGLAAGAEELSTGGGEVSWHAADVTREHDVADLVRRADDELGRVDVLVHTAGVMQRRPTLETDPADWDRVLRVNLTGTWLVARAFAAQMVVRGSGTIINTSSIYAQIVGPLPEPAYYASKAGVANLTRGLAAEWGPHGVRVNCIAPGVFYPTRMTAALADSPGRLEAMTERTMLRRLGDPATDIGGTVVWLASAASRYVTGQIIYVDGGWSAW